MDAKNLIRFGKVSEVNAEKCCARVVFEDRDSLVSAELPILQPSCLNNKFYTLPDVNDNVVCLMTPNDTQGNSGFVLGSFYTEKNIPPAQDENISMIKFSDGSLIKFNRQDGSLLIDCKGNVTIKGKNIYLNP